MYPINKKTHPGSLFPMSRPGNGYHLATEISLTVAMFSPAGDAAGGRGGGAGTAREEVVVAGIRDRPPSSINSMGGCAGGVMIGWGAVRWCVRVMKRLSKGGMGGVEGRETIVSVGGCR